MLISARRAELQISSPANGPRSGPAAAWAKWGPKEATTIDQAGGAKSGPEVQSGRRPIEPAGSIIWPHAGRCNEI